MTVATPRQAPAYPTGLRTLAPLLDAGFVSVLTALALVGFRTSYGGSAFVVAGVVGVVLGVALSWASQRFRQPSLALIIESAVVFFAVGGAVALPDTTVGHVLPTADTVRGLASGATSGWYDLVTVRPPVSGIGNLLVIPFLCAFVASVAGHAIAARTRRPALAVAPPAAVVVLTILVGTQSPASIPLQGSVFAAVCMVWLVLRHQRRAQPQVTTSTVRTRALSGALVVVAAASLGLLVGPAMPLADAHQRLVLRDHVDPPFDPSQYPTPLGAFRKYVDDWKDTPLFSVTGLPKGTRVRLAALDGYDGLTWHVTSGSVHSVTSSGVFQRVAEQVSPVREATVPVEVTIDKYANVWLPMTGQVAKLTFKGKDATRDTDSFRYNAATGTGIVAAGLREGDRYRAKVVLPTPPDKDALLKHGLAAVSMPVLTNVPDAFKAKAGEITASAPAGYAQADALAAWLAKGGGYSDGKDGQTRSLPGHGAARMAEFIAADQPVGNGEQFASAMALMARQLGIPARVVLGFTTPAAGSGPVTVKGSDVMAWAEVDTDGYGWQPLFPTPPKTQIPQKLKSKPQPQSDHAQQQQPPTIVDTGDDTNATSASTDKKKPPKQVKKPKPPIVSRRHILWAALGVLPLALLLGPIVTILAVKARRRRRRRSRGSPGHRIAAGWREIVDVARDLGRPVPTKATRREAATVVGSVAASLAHEADRATFGPVEPTDEDAAAFWAEVERARTSLFAGVGSGDRARARLSLTSLRGSGDDTERGKR